MATKRNLFRQNPNQTRGGMIYGDTNTGVDPRSRMLAQRDAERRRVVPRPAPAVANTYEGRQAQQQAYLQSVQLQKQQVEMQNAMKSQTINNKKIPVFDQNAKAATNRAISATRNSKASREAVWEEKRRRNLANRQSSNQNKVHSDTAVQLQQQMQFQQQQQQNRTRVSFAPPQSGQQMQQQQQQVPSNDYRNQLNQQVNESKQINLQNNFSRQPTSNVTFGANTVEDNAAKRRRAAQTEYANALQSQIATQEQQKREEKARIEARTGGVNKGIMPNYAGTQKAHQQNIPYDPLLEEKRKRKQQYKAELDEQMRMKKQAEMQVRGGGNDMPGGGGLQVGIGGSRLPSMQRDQSHMPYDPIVDAKKARKIQYKQELDAQMYMKKQSNMSRMQGGGGGNGGGIMNQIGNNRQPHNGRRGRADHVNSSEEEEKLRKRREQQAYLQELDMQMKLKDERKKREKKKIQDEERRFMEIGQRGANAQKVSAQQEMFLMAGGINTNLNMVGSVQPQQMGMMQQPQQMGTMQQQQMQAPPPQQQHMGMIQQRQAFPQQARMLNSNNMPNSNNRTVPQNQKDHLTNHMGLLHQNNDASAIYKHRFRDGIKDPAEIDALRERHIQQAKQNQLLAQQVADNKRRKEEAERKKKQEEFLEEQRLQKEREELKKQYEDEVASQKAKKEAQQKAMLDEQIKSKRQQKEALARKERERVRKENERIEKDRAEMAKQYERETGKSPPKQAASGGKPQRSPPLRNNNNNNNNKQQETRGNMMYAEKNSEDGHGGGRHTARIKELEARLASAEKRALQNSRGQEVLNQRLNSNTMKPPGSAPAPHPVTPQKSVRRSNQPGNETIRKEQASLLRKHDNMRAQMEKQMRLLKEMQVKLDVRESEASRYQQELAKLKGMVQTEKQKRNSLYLDDFVHAQEKALHAEIDDELTRLLEGGVGPNTPSNKANDSIELSQFDTPRSIKQNTFRNDSSGGLAPLSLHSSNSVTKKSPDALDKYINQNEQGRHALNESIPSQSKFVFPDGQTAPAPNVSTSARQGYQHMQNSPVKLLQSPSPIKKVGLGGDRINMSTDGQSLMDDSLNIDFVLNKNADKLNQLEQLGVQGEGGELHADQLDQMLVDFLNQNNGPHRNRSSDASALLSPIQMHGGMKSVQKGRDLDLPPLKLQNLGDSFSGTLQGDSRFLGGGTMSSSRAF